MLVSEQDPQTFFAPLAKAHGILVGLSGGPDSVAALTLLSQWPGHPPLFAATFDHGFRAESRAEAEQCTALCAQFNIPHAILNWEGDKPTTRIQEEARAARYAALIAHAKEIGADHLVTAHHADDQMETILFRLMRGSAIGGLAGMRAQLSRDGITHTRPFLSLRKSELIAVCEAQGLNYIRDPSNEDPRFARTQMRRLTGQLEEAGLGPETFARLAARAARAEAALAESTEHLKAEAVLRHTDETTELNAKKLKNAPEELVLRLLMAEIGRIGQMPRLEQAEALAVDLSAAWATGRPWRATLGGALIDLKSDSVLVISREAPRRVGN
jgi:tRNA(Ile)-lysidine synthase